MRQQNLNASERTDQTPASAQHEPSDAAAAVEATVARGAMVVIYRRAQSRLELLLLHRAAGGSEYEGDWAWTPPTGQREPEETIDACARRELLEETGLDLTPKITDCGIDMWPVYIAEAAADALVTLEQEPEHDRFAWLLPEEALDRCRPDVVRQSLQAAVSVIQKTLSEPGMPTVAVSVSVRATHGVERVT